jgi:hypothetical protein
MSLDEIIPLVFKVGFAGLLFSIVVGAIAGLAFVFYSVAWH